MARMFSTLVSAASPTLASTAPRRRARSRICATASPAPVAGAPCPDQTSRNAEPRQPGLRDKNRPDSVRRDRHGLVDRAQRFIDEGDPYVAHIDATRFGILERLTLPNRQLLGFQSRTGPVKWIGPGTEEVLVELGEEGVEDVVIVPLSFVSDHIETLYEVDMLFADAARAAGITGYHRPPALNTRPLFIKALAGLVLDKLQTVDGRRDTSGASTPELAAAGAA